MANCGSGRWRSDAAPPDTDVTQFVLPLETPPALGRADFIVVPGNREAVAFVDAFPDWPASAAVLCGPAGSGKSHLVTVWAKHAGADIVEAATLDAAVLQEARRPLAIENLDAAAPDAAREAVLFALFERGAPLLLTGREPPSVWPVQMPDLASRYRALLAFALWTPDDALLGALARKLFADRQLTVPDAVIEQMIRALERAPGAIRDFVARADAEALARHRPITTALVRELLPR